MSANFQSIQLTQHLPCLPPKGEDRLVTNEKQDGKSSYSTRDYHGVHKSAEEEFAELSECGPIQDVTDGVEVLILWIFNKPHSSGAHDIPTCCQ